MTQHITVARGDELIIHSPTTGYLRAVATENRAQFESSALLEVRINAAALPGVAKMTINVNTFDVWDYNDVEALKRVAREVLKPEASR